MRLFLLLLSMLTLADPAQAILRAKFQIWFPTYNTWWATAGERCSQELQNYYNDNRTVECPHPCACAADCLLDKLPGTMSTNFASAQVLLGLTPTILIFFGPTIAETAALSTYRPFLTVLLAFGSPAVNVRRLSMGQDVKIPFTQPVRPFLRRWAKWLDTQSPATKLYWTSMSYLLAVAAITNNIRNSVYTDLRTICGWRCGAMMMPLTWSLLAGVVHGWGMIAVRMRSVNNEEEHVSDQSSGLRTFRSVWPSEDTAWSEILFLVASLCAVVHLVFGVLDLSSLVFISALEALQVFTLYMVSAFICQLVLLLELARMRWDLEKEADEQAINSKSSTKIYRLTGDNVFHI